MMGWNKFGVFEDTDDRELEAELMSTRKTLDEAVELLKWVVERMRKDEVNVLWSRAELLRDAVALLRQAPLGGSDAEVLAFVVKRKALVARIELWLDGIGE